VLFISLNNYGRQNLNILVNNTIQEYIKTKTAEGHGSLMYCIIKGVNYLNHLVFKFDETKYRMGMYWY
jgi:hypothetical protein